MADGLAAAHTRGTIHGDVTPHNILVTQNELAKIGSFAICRSHGDAQLTPIGTVIGNPLDFAAGPRARTRGLGGSRPPY